MRKKIYDTQVSFRTTLEITEAIDKIAASKRKTKTEIINELLGTALALSSKEDSFEDVERRLLEHDKQIAEIKRELELAVKK